MPPISYPNWSPPKLKMAKPTSSDGHSFGANVALYFGSLHPDQALTVFVSGTAGFFRSPVVPYAMWLDGIVTVDLPSRLRPARASSTSTTRSVGRGQSYGSYGSVRSLGLCSEGSEMLGIPVAKRADTGDGEG